MARYGRDYGPWGRGTYDMDYNAGYRGLENDPYWRSNRYGRVTRGFDIGPSMGGYDVDLRTFRDRGGYRGGYRSPYDRDLGDRLREGWDDLRRGMRRRFGHRYDRGW